MEIWKQKQSLYEFFNWSQLNPHSYNTNDIINQDSFNKYHFPVSIIVKFHLEFVLTVWKNYFFQQLTSI